MFNTIYESHARRILPITSRVPASRQLILRSPMLALQPAALRISCATGQPLNGFP